MTSSIVLKSQQKNKPDIGSILFMLLLEAVIEKPEWHGWCYWGFRCDEFVAFDFVVVG